MQFKSITGFISILFVTIIPVQYSSAQTIVKNQSGMQGDYSFEYWKDSGNGTMTLGEGGNFSCSWDSINNILFRKGIKPGSKSQVITYAASFNPGGNSYLAAYGWTKNPLIEFYIIENWGTWKPPGATSKGTFNSDGWVYEIYEKIPTVRLAINAQEYKQFWSVRQLKRTSGTITCSNHFDAWASKNMVIGDMYEVSFLVEGYQSRGNADITMSMTQGSTAVNDNLQMSQSKIKNSGISVAQHLMVTSGGIHTFAFNRSENSVLSPKVYNLFGQEVTSLSRPCYSAGKQGVIVNLNSAGKYFIH